MKKIFFTISIISASLFGYSQNVGINTTGALPNASAGLDIDFTNKGLLVPRVPLTSTTDVVTIPTPATSLLVYNTNAAMTGGALGYWYYDGTQWVPLTPPFPTPSNDWRLLGNSGTNVTSNFLGTIDNVSLAFRTNNSERVRILNTGQVAVNGTVPFGGTSVLSSYAGGTSQAISASSSSSVSSIQSQQTGTGRAFLGGIFNTASTVAAVQGQTNGATGSGVAGFHTGSGSGYGVQGSTSSATGAGVFGFNGSASGVPVGVVGLVPGVGVGVRGVANGTLGSGGHFTNAHTGGTGATGSGNNLPITYLLPGGSGASFNGQNYGVHGFAWGGNTTASAGGNFRDSISAAQDVTVRVAAYVTGTQYKIIGGGAVSTIVKDANNNERIMFASEAPEVLFEDYGKGQLINGKAVISLDPIYTKNIVVNDKHDLRVFIQLEGDCNGVYVANKTQDGFEVIELANGSSNVKFSYHVVANRADAYENGQLSSKYEDLRFPDAPKKELNISIKNNTIKEVSPANMVEPKK